jgi:hypothetical protein
MTYQIDLKPKVNYEAAITWAKENCETFLSHTVIDLKDFSQPYDEMCRYEFSNAADAALFLLAWCEWVII